MKLLSALSSLVILGSCLDAPPETSGPTDVGTLDGAALDEADAAPPEVGDAARMSDLPESVSDATPDVKRGDASTDAAVDATMDAGELPCGENWIVKWDSKSIDISAAAAMSWVVPAAAGRALVYLAGGNGANSAGIFRSENGEPMVSVVEKASAQFNDARCGDGRCWFGGGAGKFAVTTSDGIELFAAGAAPPEFEVHSVGAMSGFGAAFTSGGVVLAPGENRVEPDYLPFDEFYSSRAACNRSECFATAVASSSASDLRILRLDEATREVTIVTPSGLPACGSPSCEVAAVAASRQAWYIAFSDEGLMRSLDGGSTWTGFSNALSGEVAWGDVEFHGATGFVIADGKLNATIDDGVHWKPVSPPTLPVRGISLLDRFSGVVVDDAAVRWFDIVCPM